MRINDGIIRIMKALLSRNRPYDERELAMVTHLRVSTVRKLCRLMNYARMIQEQRGAEGGGSFWGPIPKLSASEHHQPPSQPV